jgi:hypothetical protein
MPMPGGMPFFGQPPPPGHGEMGGPWAGPMFGGYGPQMNGPGSSVGTPSAGGPQDWNKKSFRNKNPAEDEDGEAEEGENNETSRGGSLGEY